VGLDAERVVDRHKIGQAALGGADEIGPVAGREQLAGSGVRLAPCGGVPTGTVERDGEMNVIRHFLPLGRNG
jgi:hypothetical protein